MDYHGTNGDDEIDQAALKLGAWSNLYGGTGNDTIRVGNATAVGEAGNDTIIGTTHHSTVAYWGSPAGVTVNLATGVAQDGFGGTDRLSGIYVVQSSGFSDRLIGSKADETFWLGGGNDSVVGGGGHDQVIYYGLKASEAAVTYSAATDTFTVVRNAANGERGTDTLQGVDMISFRQPDGADAGVITKDMYVDIDGFRRGATFANSQAGLAQFKPGDFNGDGIADFVVSSINWADVGVTPVKLQVYLGDGHGGFAEGSARAFAAGAPLVHYVPRIFAADFNNDGISDIFCPDFGVDGPPFPGGQNSLFLSSPTSGLLAEATSTLPQALRQNHGTSIGDINGDGYLDILVNALNENTGHANDLLVNDGTGHFVSSPALLPASLRPAGFDPGHTWSMIRDLNGDGAGDIVLGTWDPNPNPSQVLLNDGHGSFASSVPIGLPRSGIDKEIVVGIETIDLNGDALPDLVLSVTNGGDNNVFYQVPYLQLLVNDGNGRFHDETQLRLPQSKTVAADVAPDWYLSTSIVDLNNDGFQDILVDGAGGGPSKILMNDGHGVFAPGWQSSQGAHVVATDVDRDGMLDLIVASGSSFGVLYNTMANGHIYSAPSVGGSVVGSQLADTMRAAASSGTIDGGGGLDTAVYAGAYDAYKVLHGASGFTVQRNGAAGTADALSNIERLKFNDATVALDVDGTGGQAYRIYQAAFGRVPDGAGLGYWIGAMDQGLSLAAVTRGFVESKEFKDLYGANPSNAEIVSKFYENVLHRPAEPAGYEYWVGVLDKQAATTVEVLMNISESQENRDGLIGIIGNGFAYTPFGG